VLTNANLNSAMKSFIGFFSGTLCFLFVQVASKADAQTIIGTWQVVKQTSCLEDEMPSESDSVENMFADMKSREKPTPQIVRFKEKGSGEESTRILNKRRSANGQHFMYKFDNETLYILDKKSHTLIEAYTVDKFSADSLILSNSSRECETKILLKIKEAR
jgi:hypothetical protein